MKVVTSTVEVEGGLENESGEAIKSMEGVSGCVNGSIGVSGKDKCKSYHSWLFKSKALYLEEGLLQLAEEKCASIFKLKLTRI